MPESQLQGCWAGDITYIRTSCGWRYLAVWIDLYSRRVVGLAMGTAMEATLVLEALNRALGHRQIAPDQLLIHTDQRSQYRAIAYRQLLATHKISCSMSGKGCCWDNAVVESFFSPSNTRWNWMTARRPCFHPSSCKASWLSGSTAITTVSVVTNRLADSAQSTMSSSSSLSLHPYPWSPDTWPPN
jgi:transposase InsO family protein